MTEPTMVALQGTITDVLPLIGKSNFEPLPEWGVKKGQICLASVSYNGTDTFLHFEPVKENVTYEQTPLKQWLPGEVG